VNAAYRRALLATVLVTLALAALFAAALALASPSRKHPAAGWGNGPAVAHSARA
jgi:hypothetical protein